MERTKIKPSHADYPVWVCRECATEAGGHPRAVITWHTGTCEICGEMKSVTEPRDFGYPVFEMAQRKT